MRKKIWMRKKILGPTKYYVRKKIVGLKRTFVAHRHCVTIRFLVRFGIADFGLVFLVVLVLLVTWVIWTNPLKSAKSS